MTIQLGPYQIDNPVLLAPMAGVTDRPFRTLCRQLGAGLVFAEMLTSDTALWNSRKSRARRIHEDEPGPIAVQIVGGEPGMLAAAAIASVQEGAQIIDINMGCPKKKVCRKAAGSSLLRDPGLVREILGAVCQAVEVPVTLKIRTGWCPQSRNAEQVAELAQEAGIRMLTVHGRTRNCGYQQPAEYETIARVRQAVTLPLIANGDIHSPEQAARIMELTGADGIMIGRAAQGRPWLAGQMRDFLLHATPPQEPASAVVEGLLLQHLAELHTHYGEYLGPRIARKHVGWYLQGQKDSVSFRNHFNRLDSAQAQLDSIRAYFSARIDRKDMAA